MYIDLADTKQWAREGVRSTLRELLAKGEPVPGMLISWAVHQFAWGEPAPRSLAGKPLAGFRATPSRRITVLYGMVVYVLRVTTPLLHRQSTLRKRRLGENRSSRPDF